MSLSFLDSMVHGYNHFFAYALNPYSELIVSLPNSRPLRALEYDLIWKYVFADVIS